MASIDKRPDGRYRARWREYPGGPQKVRHFARKRDADQFLDAIRGDSAHGTYVDPRRRPDPVPGVRRELEGRSRSTAPGRQRRSRPTSGCTRTRTSAGASWAPSAEATCRRG